MSSDKLNIIKNYKFNEEILQLFESALKKLHEEPEETELLPNGEARVSQTSQMERLISICLLNLEMNLASMKHSLAMHLEHTLTEEITTEKLNDMMNQTMKKLGIDKDRFEA